MSYHSVKCPAELMSWPGSMEHKPIRFDQQAQLLSVRILGAVKPDIKVAGDVYWILVGGDVIKNSSQFVVKFTLYRR